MSQNPSASGRNTPGLPRVGIGDQIKPSHINKLSEAIASKSVTFGHGTTSQGTPNGSIVSFSQTHPHFHPWRSFIRGDRLFITLGQFYIDMPLAGGVQLSNNAKVLGGGPNAWHFNTSLPYAVGYYGEDFPNYPCPNGYHMGGAELWIEDPDANYLSSKQIYYGMDPFHTKMKAGLWYVEVAAWGGRQMQPQYTGDKLNAYQQAANTGVTVFNEYSTVMKGRMVPQLRFATPADMVKIKRLVYPVITVDDHFSIFQGVSSDIFHKGSTFTPLRVSLASDASGWKAYVAPGTVNRMPPKIGSVYIDAEETPSIAITGEGYICIKADYEANTFFPRLSTALFSATLPPDTNASSYYPLAKINKVTIGQNVSYSVLEMSQGNLVVNRIKAGANLASWQWGTV